MLEEPMEPLLGVVILQARGDSDVDALVDGRVRGVRPQREDPSRPGSGDAQGAGSYKNFIVMHFVSDPINERLPYRDAEVAFRCYGTDDVVAYSVYLALVKAMHYTGPRVTVGGLGIYRIKVLEGGSQETDPDTGQPYVTGTLQVIATAQVLA